ncbi:hypothetical protein CG018_07080 [Gemella sp. ND 6198]|uniref:hypothetical protein n=1 Tax=Gemella sp. ND 6198 TaxID=2040624 RepID=UPI000E0C3871|nr:hypothetical protein [Gemella sp. ND 6198]AXI27180.1 hypothetical protein CG018_07080 [Gemella sp. ND 6198]
MDTAQKIRNYLPYLSEKQLEILFNIILSWQNNVATIETNEKIVEEIYSKTVEKIENPFINLSNEELLEEYGPLFYNFKGVSSPNDIEINHQNSYKKIYTENLTDQEEDISGNKFTSQHKKKFYRR